MESASPLVFYTLEEVMLHDNEDDCWIVINDKVYDVTPYIEFHPGGKGLVSKAAGRDATHQFYVESEHSQTAIDLLKKYEIGVLKQNKQ